MPYTELVSKKVGYQDGKTIWELHEMLSWCNGIYSVVVPVGFQCDFASVPRLPVAYLLVGGMGEIAGTIHDYLYREGSQLVDGRVTREPSRSEADYIFYNILGEEGVSWWKRKAMYHAVRVGAGRNWHKRKVMEPFIKQEVWK
jgi:hypothetical protein